MLRIFEGSLLLFAFLGVVTLPPPAYSFVLRSGGIKEDEQHTVKSHSNESPCNSAHDESSCYATRDETGQSCLWCRCQAVPSECLSSEQSKLVPPGVFDCTTPEFMDFSFLPGLKHTLHMGQVDDTLCDASSKSLSGYMDISGSKYDKGGEDKHLFYWMFEKRGQKTTHHESKKSDEVIPFVVWLTGGPGCSSTLALLMENGPCTVKKDGESTELNPYSWTEAAHVLWLDQPAGVGYSYGEETDSNEDMVGEDAYYFLQAFFQAHPEYVASPLFITGESYAGHYVPAIAHRVWKGNSKEEKGTIKLNLAGVAIGNGLTNPPEQYPWYPVMAYNNSHGIQVVDETTFDAMMAVVPKCEALLQECNRGDSAINTFACQSSFLVCNMGLISPYQMTGLNPYDITHKCEVPPLCYDMSHITKWLNLDSTRKALHVDKHSHRWQSCNMGINMKFHTDWMKDFSPYIADLLNAGIPALIYAGDLDFICNYLGNRAWTLALKWNGHEDFVAATDHDWKGKGLARTAGGFTFLQVYDGGHMVPLDQPQAALEMISTFVTGGQF